MRPLVVDMLSSGIAPREVAEKLRTDTTLSDVERRAALNVLSKHCSDAREHARDK
jgi:hypothetical protein